MKASQGYLGRMFLIKPNKGGGRKGREGGRKRKRMRKAMEGEEEK